MAVKIRSRVEKVLRRRRNKPDATLRHVVASRKRDAALAVKLSKGDDALAVRLAKVEREMRIQKGALKALRSMLCGGR
jgi:hypothetical protein